jgi:trk system potassium uptake protein TrkA
MGVETPPQLIGRMVRNLNVPGEINIIGVTRQGRAFIPISGTEFQEGDMVHAIVLTDAIDRFKNLLGLGDGG